MLKKSACIAWVIAAGVSGLGAFSVAAGEADNAGHPLEKKYNKKSEAVDERPIRPIIEGRVRFETVERDGYADNSEALTLRLRAGVEADVAPKTTALVDFEWVEALVDDYYSTTNGKKHLPKLADPEMTELNRLQIQTRAIENTILTAGRQRILLDDQRFIGNDLYRQNEQTFDAVRAEIKPSEKWALNAIYLNQTNTVFGPDSDKGRYTGDSYLVNATRKGKQLSVTGFAYLIDVDEFSGKLSSQTYGVRAEGKAMIDGRKLEYQASYARQSDFASAQKPYEADYYMAEANLYATKKVRLGLGHEVLGHDTYQSFQTPLGSTHEFQGFANQFAITPLTGVRDTYGEVLVKMKDRGPFTYTKLQVLYHHFEADDGSGQLGSEFDMAIGATFRNAGVKLKYADYQAEGWSKDTRKFAITVQVPFP